MIRLRQQRTAARRGFSRCDVLVVLGLVVLLGTLLAPGILTAQQKVRPLECLSNMRKVGLAFQTFAARNQGHLPPLTTSVSVSNSSEQVGEMMIGWPINLLPSLDSADLHKKITETAVVNAGKARIADSEQVSLPFMTCPNDPEAHGKPGRMSFVINVGFISRDLYNGDPDRKHVLGALSWNDNDVSGEPADIAVHAATGVIWAPSKSFQPSLDKISLGDGCTSTLLMTENLQAGNWFDTDTTRIGFGFPVANIKGRIPFGKGATFESKTQPLNTDFKGGAFATTKSQDWWINAELKSKPGTLPRPSSNHAGYVNVVMCDGAARRLNQKIDPRIYLQMITSNGVTYGEGFLPLPF